MPLKVEMRKILRAEVVPWEIAEAEGQENLYGVAYTTVEGHEEGEPIGTKAEAEEKSSKRSRTRRWLHSTRRQNAPMAKAGMAAKVGGRAFKTTLTV